jgi:hypothetical protein
MARKFKKKLAPKRTSRKTQSVLSVELVRKETLLKIKDLYQKAYKFLMNKSIAS